MIRSFDPQSEGYLDALNAIAEEDVEGLKKAQRSYGNSWKQRGGVGAFMMLARKWDRLQNRVARRIAPRLTPEVEIRRNTTAVSTSVLEADPWDIFAHVLADPRAEGIIDDIRDLRRYLLLVEADLRDRGFGATHRDNREDA